MTTVRSRFAPSPTGYLHIGGARTALFAYLAAKEQNGTLVLRIDDTDRQRSTREFQNEILESLHWLELDGDEGPYFQSQRTALYEEAGERLLSQGKAYRCYCTPEELQAKRETAQAEGRQPAYDGTCRDYTPEPGDTRPFTVRFKSPKEGETVIDDIIKGRVVFQNQELDDLILVRSDGSPTYNFCSVFDDADLRISHVVRGDDHLSNTPRQVLIFRALDATPPAFAHLPLILGPDRVRLSKRHGATSVTAYREMGYLPDALVNFIARLGWSHGDEEIFSRAELIQKFHLADVGKSAGIFNAEKLEWLNFQYQQAREPAHITQEVKPFLTEKGYSLPDDVQLSRMLKTLQPRAKTLVELAAASNFYLTETVTFEEKAAKKFLSQDGLTIVEKVRGKLKTAPDWTEEALHAVFTSLMEELELKLGKIAQPIRVALTGGTASPGIFEVMEVLGKEQTLARLDTALTTVRDGNTNVSA